MAELSKIRKNGVDYDIKDAVARKAIEDLEIPEGGNSAQPDWNADEGEPGHILNKPEGVGYIEMEVLYDGELSYSDTVYHAQGFLAEYGETYTITWNGTPYTCTAKTIVADGVLAIVLGNVGVFVPEEEQTGEPFVYSWDETSGPLWFSFDENGNEINDANRLPTAKIEHHKTVKIPPQYLPEVVTDEQIASAVEDYMAEHPVSGGEAIDYDKNVRAVAHRGYSTEAPENTIPAYILAKQKGFNYAECDVSFTSDGVAVLLHDGSIDRTSNGSGSISSMTYDEASKYDYGSWKNTKYNGTRIPTFAEFIATCKAIGLHPYIELKSNGSYTEEQIAGIVAAVKAHGMTGKVTYISFNATFLAYVKNAAPSARLGYLANNVNSTAIGDAVALKTDSNEVYLGACYDNLNDDGIQLCIEADLPLEIWTVNNTSAIQNMNAYITGVTSDKLIAGKILHDAGMIYEYGMDGEDVHTHSYTSAVTTPATCTTEGVKTFTCSCGNSYTEKIPVIAHNYVNGICSVCGAADPSGGDTDERTPLYSWDLTQSLTDTVGGVVAETNATRDGTGVVFDAPESGGGHYIDFGAVYAPNRTFEIDVASMELDTTASPHARLFAVDTDTDTGAGGSGFVFHSGLEKWKFYAYGTGWMNEAMNGDTNVFSGKTVSIKVDADCMASVYIDGVLLLAASRAFPEYENGHAYIGGSVTDALYDVTISGFRVYEGASH